MSSAEVALCVFPTGIGEEDVKARGEAPVLLAATADTVDRPAAPSHLDLLHPEQREGHVSPGTVPSSALNNNNRVSPANTAVAGGGVFPLASSSAAATSPSVAELTCHMHYMAANYLCAVQRGVALARCLPSTTALPSPSPPQGNLVTPAGGFAELEGGQRCYYVCPVEDGRYMAAVSLPSRVWHQLGGGDGVALAHYLLHFTLMSTSISPGDVRKGVTAGNQSEYVTLHARLTSHAEQVQQRALVGVRRLAQLGKESAMSPQRYAARVAALRRLCREEVSPLRTHPRLGQRVEELLRTATSSTDPASLRGVMPTMGLASAEQHRYVLAAASLWYRGHPLYASLTSAEQQQSGVDSSLSSKQAQLRSAALSVMLEDTEKQGRAGADMSYQYADNAAVRVTAQCCRTAPLGRRQPSHACTAVSGYISQSTRGCLPTWSPPQSVIKVSNSADAGAAAGTSASSSLPCGVSMAFTSSSGWTVALLLQPMQMPYVGSPLSTIFSGVQAFMTENVESDTFVQLVREATGAMRGSSWRRPVHVVSPLATKLEAAVMTIKVGRRLPGAAAEQDKVLYFLDVAAATASPSSVSRARSLSSSSPAAVLLSRSMSPFKNLHCMRQADKVDQRRRAALITASAEAQQRRSLNDANDDCSRPNTHNTENGQGRRGSISAATCDAPLSPAVDAVVQTAMRYVHLTARIQRASRSSCIKGVRPTWSSYGAPSLHHRRSYAVCSTVTEDEVVRLVRAAPCVCNAAAFPNVASYAVTYIVVELEKKKMPAGAHDELHAFTSWILARCL